jgi:methylthioribulose-1-phosphate dehydratase
MLASHSFKRQTERLDDELFYSAASQLAEVGRQFYARGWVLGTSGNFSSVLSRDPLRLAITSTGLDKGQLEPEHFLEIDEHSNVLRGDGRPSAETLLHQAIVRREDVGAVLHTHSTWSTVLSVWHGADSGLAIEGFEMLKGLEGVRTHEHREWLPIVNNSQDMESLSSEVAGLLHQHPEMHGFLIRGHGLYTWGANLEQAKRHVEILEFLMEVLVRTRGK